MRRGLIKKLDGKWKKRRKKKKLTSK